MAAKGGGTRARIRAAAVALPRPRRLELARLAPSGSSLAIGFLLVAAAIASYGVARETSLFAIEHIEVRGASPDVRAAAESALAPLRGRSLVGLSQRDVERPLAALPEVAGATYDRAFPDTLRVVVSGEQPLAIVRRGAESWLVSARARVLGELPRGSRPALPRIWVPRSVDVDAGDVLADPVASRSVRVLAAAATTLSTAVQTVRAAGDETTLLLRNGLEVRLGKEVDVRLKLAVAAVILSQLNGDVDYLDVAVPERPVAGGGSQAQVEIEGSGG